MDIEINDLDSIGVIRDEKGYKLPPEAFTYGDNVHFTANGVETIGGHQQVFGTPGVAPHYALPLRTASQTYWLYVSLTKGYVYDGATHTNITRQTAAVDVDYTASNTRDWNGTLLGGVPILNNGVDVPQFWASTSSKLADLTNWTSGMTAKVVRSFGPYLFALNVTKSGSVYPHMVKWSHPADPGSVPSSWDETDPTVDAGETDLPDVQSGTVQDGLPLGGRFYIYKEGSVWRATLVGGDFIFDFGNSAFIETAGILTSRCVTLTGDGKRQVFASQDDIVWHDGNNVESILTNRYRKYLNNAISTSNYRNSFIYTDPLNGEVVFCYPETGETHPNRALIWNYLRGQKGAISERAIDFRNVGIGVIEGSAAVTWSTVTGTWGDYTGPWQQSIRRKLVACNPDQTKFMQMGTGTTFNGVAFTATLQREGLGMIGRKRNGDWIVDFTKRKLVNRLYLKAEGGPLNIRLGSAERPDGAITWSAAATFDPATEQFCDIITEGPAISLEITATSRFVLSGIKPQIEVLGEF